MVSYNTNYSIMYLYTMQSFIHTCSVNHLTKYMVQIIKLVAIAE